MAFVDHCVPNTNLDISGTLCMIMTDFRKAIKDKKGEHFYHGSQCCFRKSLFL